MRYIISRKKVDWTDARDILKNFLDFEAALGAVSQATEIESDESELVITFIEDLKDQI